MPASGPGPAVATPPTPGSAPVLAPEPASESAPALAFKSAPVLAPEPAPALAPGPAPAPAPEVVQMARWNSGPGGSALRAICADLENLATLFRSAADPAADLPWPGLRDACCCLGADVSMAMTAPSMPDSQAQSLWMEVLAAAQRAATDLRAGTELRSAALIYQGNVEIRAAADHLAQMTKRIMAIPSPP